MEFKDWISISGICLSLVWNAFNSLRGEVRANRSIAYNEFGSLKNSADAALIDLRAHKASLRGMQAHVSEDFTDKLKEINRELSESFNKLILALEILDGSSHSKKQDWAEGANDRWDDFVSALDRIYAPKTGSERHLLISQALDRLENCLSTTQRDLESEGKAILSPPWKLFRITNVLIILPAVALFAFYWVVAGTGAEAPH
ncbi:hypothetical protein G6L34_18280 [Agrobacterium tumefaciens]|uniref:hypothetical protein n=1 Tax=Agrobacterium tumefaciens TaxID=358 RepID=UPI0013AFC572|nr:hypothetical protein [Agrobacterium tumefaciens]NTA50060.1 hypothetical protein [Agrobacterium tumefaciens]